MYFIEKEIKQCNHEQAWIEFFPIIKRRRIWRQKKYLHETGIPQGLPKTIPTNELIVRGSGAPEGRGR